MGEARIRLRDTAAAAVPVEVERKLTVLELLWNDGFVRKAAIILFLAVLFGSRFAIDRHARERERRHLQIALLLELHLERQHEA